MKWHKLSIIFLIFLLPLCAEVDESFEYRILQIDFYDIKLDSVVINSEEELVDLFVDDVEEKNPFYKWTMMEVVNKNVDFDKESMIIVSRERCESYCEEEVTKVDLKDRIIIYKELTNFDQSKPFETITTPHVIVIPKTTSKEIEIKLTTKSG